MQEQLDEAGKRRSELEVEEARPRMSPEEQRAALLAQIKADNEAIEVAGQKARDAAEAIRQLEARLGGVESARSMLSVLGGGGTAAPCAAKYTSLIPWTDPKVKGTQGHSGGHHCMQSTQQNEGFKLGPIV